MDDPAYRAIPRAFFDRPARQVARALLGTLIAHRTPHGRKVARVVETEAYVRRDPASHAFAGPTRRNRSMFERPGTLYVFRIHQVVCANAVARRGEAVLFRAAEPVAGLDDDPSGPGRLCRALHIPLALDGTDLIEGPVTISAGHRRRAERTLLGPRVGILKARDRTLRFALDANPWVSRPRPPGWTRGPATPPT
ncbi:MAG: DNA-3-methyladenine glycosylase [Thermoplasmata archaeon]